MHASQRNGSIIIDIMLTRRIKCNNNEYTSATYNILHQGGGGRKLGLKNAKHKILPNLGLKLYIIKATSQEELTPCK